MTIELTIRPSDKDKSSPNNYFKEYFDSIRGGSHAFFMHLSPEVKGGAKYSLVAWGALEIHDVVGGFRDSYREGVIESFGAVGAVVGGAVGATIGFRLAGALGADVGGGTSGAFLETGFESAARKASDGLDVLMQPQYPNQFSHNHPLRGETINPSTAYVGDLYAGYPAYPEVTKHDIPDPSSISVGWSFGDGIYRQEDDGWHVFSDARDLPSMSSGEALALQRQAKGAQDNGYTTKQVTQGILEGYDLNGPETVIDFTPLPRPGCDNGSTYGDSDAGARGAGG